MEKIRPGDSLKPEVTDRLFVCAPFMQPDLSYGSRKAKEAMEALRSMGLKCSPATLYNDIKRLRGIGITCLDQLDFGQRSVQATTVIKPQPAPDDRVGGTRQLAAMIHQLEAEIAAKKNDLDILRAAAEVIKRRS